MFGYRREIDGLRALAVVPVIFFHAGFEAFSGGFVGVDVFFVISGYLITSIILTQKAAGTFSLLNFYERRARRILPALFLVMAVCIPFAWLWLLPSDMRDFSQSLVAVSVFASNVLFWKESGYFDTAAELKPLLHTWSLAVEEQYYVLFPLFLLVMWRFAKRWTVATLAVIAALSFALAQWGAYNKPAATFFLLPTRGWEIAIGALIAFYFARYPKPQLQRPVQEAGSLIGLSLILYAVFAYSKETPFPSAYALAPALGTALIILCTTPSTLVGRVLTTKAFVGVGLISYSAYLWHQPLFAFTRQVVDGEPNVYTLIFLSVFSLALAFITWKYVEAPFRIRSVIGRVRIFIYGIGASIFFVVVGLSGHFGSDKYEKYWLSQLNAEQQHFYSQLISTDSSLGNFGASSDGVQQLTDCRFNVNKLDLEISERILTCAKRYGSGVLVLGDSHAIDLYGVVASRFEDEFLIGITRGSCRPHTPRPECQYDALSQFVKKYPDAFRHIVYEQAGFYLMLDQNGRKGTRQMFSNLSYDQSIGWVGIDLEHIDATTKYLVELSKSAPITWFLPRIEPHISRHVLMKNGCQYDYRLRIGLREKFQKLEEAIAVNADRHDTSRLKLLSQNRIFRFEFPDDFASCEGLFWSDGDHLSAAGERRFGQRLPENLLDF